MADLEKLAGGGGKLVDIRDKKEYGPSYSGDGGIWYNRETGMVIYKAPGETVYIPKEHAKIIR